MWAIRGIRTQKPGVRCFGIAESFAPHAAKSTLAGIVMRHDGTIDGTVLGAASVSGSDSTQSIIGMYDSLHRADIGYTLISGLVISMYNMIDIEKIALHTGTPVISVTYNDSGGLHDAIRRHFDPPDERIARYDQLPDRERVRLHTGHDVYAAYAGCSYDDVRRALDSVTRQGAVSEPIRVAQLVARAADSAHKKTSVPGRAVPADSAHTV